MGTRETVLTLNRFLPLLLLISCSPPPTLEVLTYNTGLAPLDVAYAQERAPLVIEALAADGADILCIQELWREEDAVALEASVAEWARHFQRSPAAPGDATCGSTELDALATCAEAACPDLAGEALSDCAIAECSDDLVELSSGCASCVIDAVRSGGDVATVRRDCEGEGGAGFLYGGAFDVALIARYPAVAHESLRLDSSLVRASVEYATLETPLGEVQVFCTHLASEIATFAYEGPHGDWMGEQTHQVQQMLQWIADRSAPGGAVIVAGDLNTGPEGALHAARWPTNYETITGAGFQNSYIDLGNADCTICGNNTFIDPRSTGKLIDHVLHVGLQGVEASRALTDRVDLPSVGSTHLSDHFGLRVTFSAED